MPGKINSNSWVCCATYLATIFLLITSSPAATSTKVTTAMKKRASLDSGSVQFHVNKRNFVNYIDAYGSNTHHIKKRSLSCKVHSADPGVVSSHPFAPPSEAHKNYDTITLVWTGEQNTTKLIGLMNSNGEVSSSVYVSEVNGTFTKSNGLYGVILTMVERNPEDTTHVLAVGNMDDEYKSCVSRDSGSTFTCSTMQPSYMPAGTILFHSNMVMTIMKEKYVYGDGNLVLMLSRDYGSTWKIIAHDVTAALFKADSTDTVFALTQIQESSPFSGFGLSSLFRMSMDTQLKSVDISDTKIVTSGYIKGLNKSTVTGFQYAGDFLHVVTEDEDGHKILKISYDHGESFNDTHLPVTASGQYINILNTDNELIFAHVTSPTDSNVGTLYTSGVKGMFYTESLSNHVSDDFYNAVSMDGVYLTTQMMGDKSLRTMISMDRGAEWKPITVKDCDKDDCTLQIYGEFLIAHHRKTGDGKELAQSPHSSANAKGIIIAQGIISPKIRFDSGELKYKDLPAPGVFISGDGGYTWIKAPNLKGAFHLLIEDSGGVIQALAMDKPLTEIHYSVDEGTCWNTIPVNAVLKNFTIKGLVAQPGQKSLNLGIVGHGVNATNNQITWEIIDVNFKPILKTACTSNDLEPWDADLKCYLGKKRSYQRIKKSSWCYLNSTVSISAKVQYCPCTRSDYECDYGFIKDPKTEDCVKDSKFANTITYCLDDRVYTLESSGYRKLPGDDCDKDHPDAALYDTTYSTKATDKVCDEANLTSYVDIAIVREKLCGQQQTSTVSDHQGLVAATVLLTLISSVLCVALTTLYCKYKTLHQQYQYSAFDDPAWSVNRDSPSNNRSSGSTDEGIRIAPTDNGGRSYTRLKETGAESDVDLLNM